VRHLVLRLARRLYRLAMRVDRSQVRLFRRIPSRWKRSALRVAFRLAGPLLPASVSAQGVRLAAPRSHLFGFVLQPHEPEIVAVLDRLLGPGMTAVDVGANIGYLTLQMARRVGPGGRVVAIEPAADNLAWLRRNVALNGFENVEIHAAGAGAEERERELHLEEGSTRYGFYGGGSEAQTVAVREVPLDGVVDGPADLVKIDVEGAEIEVLAGMQRLLADSPRLKLIVEWNPPLLERAGRRSEELVEVLSAHGFTLHLIGTGGALEPLVPSDATRVARAARERRSTWHGNLLAERRGTSSSASAAP